MCNDFMRAVAKEEEETERISESVTLTGFMVVLFAIFLTQEAKVGLTRNRIVCSQREVEILSELKIILEPQNPIESLAKRHCHAVP